MILLSVFVIFFFFFFQAEDGIRDVAVTGVQTCALPILLKKPQPAVVQIGTVGDIAKAVPANFANAPVTTASADGNGNGHANGNGIAKTPQTEKAARAVAGD